MERKGTKNARDRNHPHNPWFTCAVLLVLAYSGARMHRIQRIVVLSLSVIVGGQPSASAGDTNEVKEALRRGPFAGAGPLWIWEPDPYINFVRTAGPDPDAVCLENLAVAMAGNEFRDAVFTVGTLRGQAPPVIKMEAGCTPVETSRVFQTGLGPNLRGGWNFICQCMNYKSTGNKEKFEEKLDDGRHYLRYADPTARPDAEWVIADFDEGTFKVVKLPGFHAAEISGGGCLAGNGRVFFAVDYGHIYYYEPREDTIRILGRVHDSITVLRHFYKLELGPDGLVYGASQSAGGVACVLRLDPDTLEWTLITEVGLPGRRTLTYGYTIGMEPPWIYVAVGQGKWELCAVNFETGEKRVLAQRDDDDARIVVEQGAEFCKALLRDGRGDIHVALCDGRIVSEAGPGEAFAEVPQPRAHAHPERDACDRVLAAGPPPEVDPGRRVSISGRGEGVFYWRKPGDKSWRETRFAIRNTEPAAIESLTLLPDGSVLGSVAQYHGWFRYDPATGQCEHMGKGGPSGAKTVVSDGKVYVAGYPNTVLSVYDPETPWTSPRTGEPGDPALNPAHLGYQGQGRSEAHHAVAMAAAGTRVYTWGLRERWSSGAGLSCYDTATGEYIALGEAYKNLEPVHMIAMPALDRIIVSGATQDAVLFVHDLDLNRRGEIEIEPGLGNTGHMLRVTDTQFLGWYRKPGATNTTLYLYDLAAQTKLHSVDIEMSSAWVLERPADRTYWITSGADLHQVDPVSLEIVKGGRLDRPIDLPVAPDGSTVLRSSRPVWIGKRLCGSASGVLLLSTAVEAMDGSSHESVSSAEIEQAALVALMKINFAGVLDRVTSGDRSKCRDGVHTLQVVEVDVQPKGRIPGPANAAFSGAPDACAQRGGDMHVRQKLDIHRVITAFDQQVIMVTAKVQRLGSTDRRHVLPVSVHANVGALSRTVHEVRGLHEIQATVDVEHCRQIRVAGIFHLQIDSDRVLVDS